MVGYAGRVLVELAANAADAAVEAGVPGHLRISIEAGELRVANTGAPLSAAGVASLASLRASAKRQGRPLVEVDGTSSAMPTGVGRFGVGFTAVLALTDEPAVVSTTGSVAFSAVETAAAIAALHCDPLNDALADRAGGPPVLRLPFPIDATPPAGFSTEVRLPLRPGVDLDHVLREVGDHLLLALPALERIDLPDRSLTREVPRDGLLLIHDGDVDTNWRLLRRDGVLSEAHRAGLPVEQRRHTQWRLTWAYPVDRPLGPDVLYSPTPTDEELDLPARLIGSFPVDDTRRHLAPGPLTDELLAAAIEAYVELMADTEPDQRLRLLPARGFGRSALDNRLRQGILGAVLRTPLLVSASGMAVRPDQAVVLPAASAELIQLAAEAVPGLLPVPASAVERDGLRALGVASIGYAALSTAFGALQRPPDFWGRVYAQLGTGASAGMAGEELADLPMPLIGGRTVFGARRCLVVGGSDDAATTALLPAMAAAVPGLAVLHPDAVAVPGARSALIRLGAQPADPAGILATASVTGHAAALRDELESGEVDEDRVRAFGSAVLNLLAAGAEMPASLRASLLLTTADEEPWPAGELLLPDAPLAAVLDDDADLTEVGSYWTDNYDDEVLQRAGVLTGFRIVTDPDPSGPDHDLADEAAYWAEVIGEGAPPAEFTAVADLDLVADDRWPQALELIRADRAAVAALRPVGGVRSYSSWWLGRYALLDGRSPDEWRLPGAADLAGLFDPLRIDLPTEFAVAIGVRESFGAVLADDPMELLRRFTDARRRVPPAAVTGYTAAIVEALRDSSFGDLPAGVRVLSGAVVDADRAVVLDRPWLAQTVPPDRAVPGAPDPDAVAAFFDLALASERAPARPLPHSATSPGAQPPASAAPSVAVADARLQVALDYLGLTGTAALGDVILDPELTVELEDGTTRRVSWWMAGDASWVDGSPTGWGRLLAQLAGNWQARHTLSQLIAGDPIPMVEDGLSG